MANNIQIKDGLGNTREVKTIDTGGIHTPVHHAEGPLTNAELRAAAVNVAGPLAGGAINTVITGPLASGAVQVIGPLTDAQIRATPVPVSGPFLTDGQMRATPVPVNITGGSAILASATPFHPFRCGYLNITGTSSSITPPAGAKGVRLRAFGHHCFFRFNAAPVVPATPTPVLVDGGMFYDLEWREVLFTGTATVTSIHFISDAAVTIAVEFLQAG